MSDNYMRDALIYSKWGMYAFVAVFIWTVIIAFLVPVFLLGWVDFSPPLIAGGLFFTIPSFLLALLTWQKVVKQLQDGKEPAKKWRKALEVFGYFFGLFVGGVMLYIANRKIDHSWK